MTRIAENAGRWSRNRWYHPNGAPRDDWAIITLRPLKVVAYAGGRSRKKLERIAMRMNTPFGRQYVVRFCMHVRAKEVNGG